MTWVPQSSVLPLVTLVLWDANPDGIYYAQKGYENFTNTGQVQWIVPNHVGDRRLGLGVGKRPPGKSPLICRGSRSSEKYFIFVHFYHQRGTDVNHSNVDQQFHPWQHCGVYSFRDKHHFCLRDCYSRYRHVLHRNISRYSGRNCRRYCRILSRYRCIGGMVVRQAVAQGECCIL